MPVERLKVKVDRGPLVRELAKMLNPFVPTMGAPRESTMWGAHVEVSTVNEPKVTSRSSSTAVMFDWVAMVAASSIPFGTTPPLQFPAVNHLGILLTVNGLVAAADAAKVPAPGDWEKRTAALGVEPTPTA